MEERIRPSRSGLIAIEVMVAVGVFALCAAIAIGLLVRAELMSRESAELTQAVSQARSAAECYKSVGGDLEETARPERMGCCSAMTATGPRVRRGRRQPML